MTTTSESRPQPAEGLLLVDKPEGPTSHDVVRLVRRALRTRAVGHAGTLDPFATGLLACCAGRATRLLRLFAGSEKTYEGVIRLGVATDSGDVTGVPLGEEREPASFADVERAVAARLTGDIEQLTPMHSARKVDGVPLHRHARAGRTVERRSARVRTSGWRLEPLDASRVRFAVTCSAGTYVRVLAMDLGEALGCGAHLEALRRTRSGALRVEDAVPADELGERAREALVPLDGMPLPVPGLSCVDPAAEAWFRHGRASPQAAWTGAAADGEEVACYAASGALLGLAAGAVGEIKPTVVLATP
jgi:tRNA pseudouridine55 synthase